MRSDRPFRSTPRCSAYRPKAIVTVVRTTSFTVPPQMFLTALMSASGSWVEAKICGPWQTVLKGKRSAGATSSAIRPSISAGIPLGLAKACCATSSSLDCALSAPETTEKYDLTSPSSKAAPASRCSGGGCSAQFLPAYRRRRWLGAHNHVHRAHAGNSVGQAVVDASNHSGAAALERREREVPQRPLAVQPGADNRPGQFFEFLFRTVLERHLVNVVSDVERWIELPARKPKIERRKHHPLPVTGNERQFRFDVGHAVGEIDLTLKHADPGDVQRLSLALNIKKECVSPGEGIILGLVRHTRNLVPEQGHFGNLAPLPAPARKPGRYTRFGADDPRLSSEK